MATARRGTAATIGNRHAARFGCGALLGAVAALAALAAGCAAPVSAPPVHVGATDPGAPIPGLAACDRSASELHLDPARPVAIFVHGCHDSGGRFHELAEAFSASGQQTACFNYDDRKSFEDTSDRLVEAIESLETRLAPGRITVLAHSQGGLIARRAFIQERGHPLPHRDGFSYRLITVATPFGGVDAASDCGKRWLRFATLGASAAVCDLISGSDWTELPPRSAFITRPGTLVPEVEDVLKVVTSERGACKASSADSCKPDVVFSVHEQTNAVVDADARLSVVTLDAGHVGSVGGEGALPEKPEKLIALLKQRGVLTADAAAAPQQSAMR